MFTINIMPGYYAQGSRTEFGPHLLLYDGACGLCHGVVRNVLERDRLGVFHFASLQSPAATEQLARFSGRPSHLNTFVVIVNYRDESPAQLTKAFAALFVMTALGWPWKAAGFLRVLPVALLDRTYDLIARNRYRIFGRRESCLLPRADYQRRFLDSVRDVVPGPEVWR
jgi:predicted DCC family thiol-disulfide oxidoreductase YuxK